MEIDFITQIQSCSDFLSFNREHGYLSFVYYSHIPVAFISLLVGSFVFLKNKEERSAKLLFFVAVFFSAWSFSDLILWTSVDSRKTVFFWSLINMIENLVSITTLYFAYVFLEKRDLSLRNKMIFGSLFLPFFIFLPSVYNISGFNGVLCEAQQGWLTGYFYFLEVVFFLTLFLYLLRKVVMATGEERKKILLFSFGALCFLLFFSGANIMGSVASVINPNNPDNWKILQYGLFGMPVFMGFLAYLIVQYRAFNIKVLSVQALVVALSILIGAQLFFVKTPINFILTSITFLLSIAFGILLIQSVKTEIRRKEELQTLTNKLAEANVELKRLDQSKTEFISIASHQLRTPLTAIKGFVSLLLEGSYGAVPGNIADILNKVYTSNERIVRLVEDLLNISRMEAGRLKYEYAEVNLCEFLNELRDTFAITAKKKGLELSFECPEEGTLPPVWIDRQKSFEVISNLIDNAIKYTPAGSVCVRAEAVDGTVRVSVKDTGIGIASEAMPYLFVKFSRGKEGGKVYANGTGLGLYVGKNMMEAQGGRVSVTSEGIGKGSTFFVDLPMKQS